MNFHLNLCDRVVIVGFGWWFTAEKLGDNWSLGTLLRVLSLTKEIVNSMDVVKLLAELSPQNPGLYLACLSLMLQGDKGEWVLVGVEPETRTIIQSGLDCGQPETVVSARRLAEWLIAKEQFGFRTLLA